jgi:L-alanine-DL-glutamate epimerase-like enolase superfamily enzyme
LLDAGLRAAAGFEIDARAVEVFDYNHAHRGAKGIVIDGRMWVPDRPGLGFALSEQARRRTAPTASFGKQP